MGFVLDYRVVRTNMSTARERPKNNIMKYFKNSENFRWLSCD